MIGILGAGSWGTALALQVAHNGHNTLLWEYNADVAQTLQNNRENKSHLPGITFPGNLEISHDIEDCISRCDTVLVVVPSAAFRAVLQSVKPTLTPEQGIAWGTKGLDQQNGELLYQVAAEILGNEISLAVLSGPSFALEVAQQQPTAVSLASNNDELADRVAHYLRSETFRIYNSKDLAGVCLGGAYKNVLAIAAGITDGLGLGYNAQAALITRGLAEMQRLGQALGSHPKTFTGLAGLGDLILTCTGGLSRNRALGMALAKGGQLKKIQSDIGQVTEGVETARTIHKLAQSTQTDLPIAEKVYQVLFEEYPPKEAVHALLSREPGQES